MNVLRIGMLSIACMAATFDFLHGAVDVEYDSSTDELTIDVTDTNNHDITVTFMTGGYVDVIVDSNSVKIFEAGTSQDISVASADVDEIIIVGNSGDETIDLSDVTSGNGFSGMASGTDTILGAGDDTFHGSAYVDLVCGDGGADEINGNDGADVIDGGDGTDDLDGGNGDDQIDGGFGEDAISGNSGDDDLIADDGEYDIISGGPGTDTCTCDAGDLYFP